jgi:hypothetical protein
MSRMLLFSSSTPAGREGGTLAFGRPCPGPAGGIGDDALVVVVDGDGEVLLGAVLTDAVLVEVPLDVGAAWAR